MAGFDPHKAIALFEIHGLGEPISGLFTHRLLSGQANSGNFAQETLRPIAEMALPRATAKACRTRLAWGGHVGGNAAEGAASLITSTSKTRHDSRVFF